VVSGKSDCYFVYSCGIIIEQLIVLLILANMASDAPRNHHSLRIPLPAAEAGTLDFHNGRPVIVDIDHADTETAATAPGHDASSGAASTSPTAVPTVLPSVRSLLMSCESSLPFVFIILAKLLYDHRLGMQSNFIKVFSCLYPTLFVLTSSICSLLPVVEYHQILIPTVLYRGSV